MRLKEKESFEGLFDQDSSARFEDMEFRRCRFVRSALSITMTPRLRSSVKNVRLINCEQKGCTIWSAVVEDTLVENLKTNGLLQCWGAVFGRTFLRGKIDRLMISPAIKGGLASADVQLAFDEANADYYSRVEWALDISEAEFKECELQRVPAHLVRRDPETQVVVRRSRALGGEWRDIDLSRTHWKASLELFLERGDDDVVLVAGKRNENFDDLIAGLRMLRAAGIADPD